MGCEECYAWSFFAGFGEFLSSSDDHKPEDEALSGLSR